MNYLRSVLTCLIFLLHMPCMLGQYGGVYFISPGAPNMAAGGYYHTSAPTRISVNSGHAENLRGISKVNIIYDYSELGVDFDREEKNYLARKKEEYKNDTAKFEQFRQNWLDARKKYLEPAFEEVFNREGEKCYLRGTNYSSDQAVTLKVSTIYMLTGIVGDNVMNSASIDVEFTFLDKDGNEIVRYFAKNAMSPQLSASASDPAKRLEGSYEKAAKMLIKEIRKRLRQLRIKKAGTFIPAFIFLQ